MLRTPEQNAHFYKLLEQNKYDEDAKQALIKQVTAGRVVSSKDMNRIEMAKAIKTLRTQLAESKAKTRRKQMALAFKRAREVGMLTGEGEQTDYTKLNAFSKKMYGVEKFNLLDTSQISGVIIGLTNIKKQRIQE